MQPVRSIALGVLSLQWNAEGNLKTHVLRRKRGSACVFGSMNGIKSLGTCSLFRRYIIFSIHLHFSGSDRSTYKYLKFSPTIRENRGVYFESQTIKILCL